MYQSSIIVISKENWSSSRRARKHLLFEAVLEKGVKQIFYVNPARHLWQAKEYNSPALRGVETWQGTFLFPAERYRFVRELNRLYIYFRLSRCLNGAGYRQIIYYNPLDEPLARRLGSRLRIPTYFDWTDNWPLYYDAQSLQSAQTSAVKTASGVIVVSKRLEQRACKMRDSKDRVLFLPNATAWRPYESRPCPEDMVDIPEPRIGFSGHVGPLFDQKLVKNLALARPRWHWVLVGAFDQRIREDFIENDNLHFLGPRPFDSLPAYMHHCRALVAPYKLGVMEGDATKLYDYLTTGRPVVSAAIETAKRLQPFVTISDNVPSWLDALEAALADRNDGMCYARKTESEKHTWDMRASELLEWLQLQENDK